jgi:TolB-like protein/DNA-binding winged helix-turn-helix (wHTH) protein
MDKSGPSLIARALRRGDPPGTASLARGFRLGGWLVRPDLCMLEKDGQRTALEPKTMGVLLCLAEHAPGVVTREQFIDEVWNGRVVSDEVLSRAISLLRAQFADDAAEPRFIRTVPRVGYALVATVAGAGSPAPVPARVFTRRRFPIVAGAAGLVAALGLLSWLATRNGGPSGDANGPAGPVRLAVLPLEYLGTAQQDRYMADGLTEELTVSLSRVKGLRVVARNSSRAFGDRDADLGEVARRLGTTHLVTGSVRADGNRLRVTVHLSDSGSGTEMWAESYDRDLGDLFAVQGEIAAAVTRALRERLPAMPADPAAAAAQAALMQAPASADAYRWFLQGRQQLARRGDDGIRAAIALLEDSVAADPAFLRAQLALAYAHSLLANVAPAEAATALARADQVLATVARQTAMSGEIHAVRAALELERNRWMEAADAFRAALQATPDDTELRLLHSQMLGATGQRQAALDEARLALANDPLSPAVNLRLAVLLLWADQESEAARYLKVARDLGLAASAAPELSMLLQTRARRFDELRDALLQVQRRRGQASDWVPAVVAAIEDPRHGAAAGAAIDRAATARQLDELMHLGALVLVRQHGRALRLLQSRPTLRTLELEFLWSREAAHLRQQPGFSLVVTRFGLAAFWDQAGWPPECARAGESIRCS